MLLGSPWSRKWRVCGGLGGVCVWAAVLSQHLPGTGIPGTVVNGSGDPSCGVEMMEAAGVCGVGAAVAGPRGCWCGLRSSTRAWVGRVSDCLWIPIPPWDKTRTFSWEYCDTSCAGHLGVPNRGVGRAPGCAGGCFSVGFDPERWLSRPWTQVKTRGLSTFYRGVRLLRSCGKTSAVSGAIKVALGLSAIP